MLLAGLLGQVAAWSAGVLPTAVLPVAAALLVGATRAAAAADPAGAAVLRRVSTGLALVASLLAAPALTSQGAGGVREVLGPLLVAVQVAHALTWRSPRDLRTGLVVTSGLLVLGASFAPDVLVGLPLVAGWAVCVAALVPVGAAARRVGVDVVAGDPSSGAGRRDSVLQATGLAVALGLLAFLVVPAPSSAPIGRRLSSAGDEAAPSSARARALTGERLDMRTRGQLSERVLAEVPDDGTALWRSTSYTTYDGSGWTSPGQVSRALAGPRFLVPDAPLGATTRAEVDLVGTGSAVYSPGFPVAVQADAPSARIDGAGTLLLPARTRSYVVDSVPPELDPEVLRRSAVGPADAKFLELPVSLPDRVRELAEQITAGAPTTYDKVRAVEQWLTANATYRLDSPVPGPGEDAVDRFLFVDRTGFCEQFAAAQAVLLRAVGVPTRLVVGLAYGEPVGGGRRIFREKSLHAWVEVSYADAGWAPSDPTAEAALAQVSRSLRSRLAAGLTSVLSLVDRFPGGRTALGAVLLVLLLAGGRASRRWLARPAGRKGPERPATWTGGRPALDAFEHWDDRLGPQGRRPAESLAGMRRRLDLAPSLAEAIEVVEQECYAAGSPDPGTTARAVAALQEDDGPVGDLRSGSAAASGRWGAGPSRPRS